MSQEQNSSLDHMIPSIVFCSDCKKDVLENFDECHCEELEGHDHEKCTEIFHVCSICSSQNITPNTDIAPKYIEQEKRRILKANLLLHAVDITSPFTAFVQSQTNHREGYSVTFVDQDDRIKITCDVKCISFLYGNDEDFVRMHKRTFLCKHILAGMIKYNSLVSTEQKIEIPCHESNNKFLLT